MTAPSSSRNLLNISSMFARTAFASERSRRGSRLLMIFVWSLSRTSRLVSRDGAGVCRGGLLRAPGELGGQGEDVLADLAVAVADHERHPAVHGEHQGAAVRDDGVRDLAAEARLDVAGLDAARRVVAVGDQLDLLVAVAELFGDLHEHAYVLEARDLEGHEREDDVRDVEHGDDLFLERRPRVDDDER